VEQAEAHPAKRELEVRRKPSTPASGPSEHSSEPEDIGYGKPPRRTRFKPGESGNPKGRPKGARSEAAIWREIIGRNIPVRERDKVRKISVLEAIQLKITEEALRGDFRAIAFFLNRVAATQSSDPTASTELSVEETEVMRAYAERLLKEAQNRE
jgi:hypothetical protein